VNKLTPSKATVSGPYYPTSDGERVVVLVEALAALLEVVEDKPTNYDEDRKIYAAHKALKMARGES
jgi:hypothetical protein